jgi:hypothetical protein
MSAQVRKTFYDILRNQDELLPHDEQAELARLSSESARIKYVVAPLLCLEAWSALYCMC